MENTLPNWCSNVITITGAADLVRQLHDGAVAGNFCNTVVPVPQQLVDTVSGSAGPAGSPEQIENEIKEQENIENFGYNSWYEFRVNEWGTKWDFGSAETAVFEDHNDGTATLTINEDTAWSPPIRIFERLHVQELDVLAYYYEPGMAFCGKWHNGSDECHDIKGNSKWVDDNIPDEINETFEISTNMALWEEESTEEE